MTVVRRSSVFLLAAAVVAALVAISTTPALADDTVQVKLICGFADPAIWNVDTEKNAFDSEMIVTFPDSVAPGETFEVSVDFEPQKNGPVAIRSAGDMVMSAIWTVSGTTADGEVETDTQENTDAIGVLEEYDVDPLVAEITARDSGSVDLRFEKIKIIAIGTITLVCGAFDPDGSGTAINPSFSIPIGSSSGGGSGATGTTVTSTTTTVADTTTTTEALEPYVAQVQVETAQVQYMCVPEINGEQLDDEAFETPVSIAAVDKVNEGQSFSVGVRFGNGPTNGSAEIAPSQLNSAATVGVGGGAAGPIEFKGGTNDTAIKPDASIPIAPMQTTLTASGSAGDTIEFFPGNLSVDVPDLATTITCSPEDSTSSVLSTEIVDQPVDLQNDGELPFTGISDYLPQMIIAGIALYLGLLFLSTLPRREALES